MLRFDFKAMASPCSIQLDTRGGQGDATLRHAAQAAIAEVQRIEHKYSRYRTDSIVSQINQSASQANSVELDDETAQLVAFAGNLWQMSDGLFDITSGVLRKAWDFKLHRMPKPDDLAALLPLVGWDKVDLSPAGIRLSRPGMELDFGGFGKEYAADRAAAVLQSHGIAHALVNLGGDLHALGECAWPIDVQHPRPEDGKDTLAVLSLQHGGLATSGDYERFFVHAGKRYCHVLNPFTGWPVAYWQSVTVLAANATTAGALTTIAMLKEEHAQAWLQSQGVRFLAVRQDGTMVREGTL